MNTYMISYDIHNGKTDRKKVEESIMSMGSWCKYLTTTFLVGTEMSLQEVESTAIQHLEGNDEMIICKVEKPICGYLSKSEWKWIESNL